MYYDLAIKEKTTKNALSLSQSHLGNVYHANGEPLPQICARALNKATNPLVSTTDITIVTPGTIRTIFQKFTDLL